MAYSDFTVSSKIETLYTQELTESLKTVFNARHVRVIDYLVRRRHCNYPISSGEDFVEPQPAGLAHIDFSHDEAKCMLQTMYGARAEEILQGHWQIINVWRPLKGPLFDWPLAVCDARTFEAERDSLASDVVYPEWTYENVMVHFNPSQRWYYFHALEESETMLFKGVDSDESSTGPCPHAAFPNPLSDINGSPRESIESRVFVLYAPIDDFPEETGDVYGKRL